MEDYWLRGYFMNCLDLHGKNYDEAKVLTSYFVENNLDFLPIQIITGNSVQMNKIVNEIAKKYGLLTEPKDYYNLGCLILRSG